MASPPCSRALTRVTSCAPGSQAAGAALGRASLGGAAPGGAHLQGADLGGADLRGAHLYQAHLDGAALHDARAAQSVGIYRTAWDRIRGRVGGATRAAGSLRAVRD